MLACRHMPTHASVLPRVLPFCAAWQADQSEDHLHWLGILGPTPTGSHEVSEGSSAILEADPGALLQAVFLDAVCD